jgi:hypothetical protein
MAEAADAVLGPAVWIDTDVEIVRYPGRYSDRRGQVMWDRVSLLAALDQPSLPGPNVIAGKRVVELGRLEAVELTG